VSYGMRMNTDIIAASPPAGLPSPCAQGEGR
jgi:hypothetical protein